MQSLQIVNLIQQDRGPPLTDATSVSDVIGTGPWTIEQKLAMSEALTNAVAAAPRSKQGRAQ
eukprot:3300466-Pyramimonas_sp.AAC.1